MRRLTVKNFSVISQCGLELGKVTGLIGPQSNGKSLLSNLAYFLTNQKFEVALATILSAKLPDRDKFDDLEATMSRDFLVWSPFPTWHRSHASLGFGSHSDWVGALPRTNSKVYFFGVLANSRTLSGGCWNWQDRLPGGLREWAREDKAAGHRTSN
jgi:hypothetical protein